MYIWRCHRELGVPFGLEENSKISGKISHELESLQQPRLPGSHLIPGHRPVQFPAVFSAYFPHYYKKQQVSFVSLGVSCLGF